MDLGYAITDRQQDEVVMVFFGDGATSEGDFSEALNFAGVWQTPVVFVCQNNGWAISLPRACQTLTETLAQKALAYGLPGIQVDDADMPPYLQEQRQELDQVLAAGQASKEASHG